MIRLVRFLARNRMLTAEVRAASGLATCAGACSPGAGWRWETDGPVFFGRRLSSRSRRAASVRFGRFVWIGDGTKIRCHEGEVAIGDKTVLGQECTISAYQHVRIGEQCVIADRAMFIDFDHGIVEVERPIRLQGIYKRDVDVGLERLDRLRRLHPARACKVGDNSVDRHQLRRHPATCPPNAVVGGIPARCCACATRRRRLRWPDPVEPVRGDRAAALDAADSGRLRELGVDARRCARRRRPSRSAGRARRPRRPAASRRLGVARARARPSRPARSGSRARKRSPASSCGTTSRRPPVSATMHGQPEAIASSATSPNGS